MIRKAAACLLTDGGSNYRRTRGGTLTFGVLCSITLSTPRLANVMRRRLLLMSRTIPSEVL